MAVSRALQSCGVERVELMRGAKRAQVRETEYGRMSNRTSFSFCYSCRKHLPSVGFLLSPGEEGMKTDF